MPKLLTWFGKFRHKIKYTDLLFKLVPEFFTLTELQHVYEAIIDKKVSRASFRRSIADKVLETEQYVTKGGHRPSSYMCLILIGWRHLCRKAL